VAAIGVSVGAGEYALGIFATAVVLVSLWPVRQAARYLGLRSSRTRRLRVTLDHNGSLAGIVGAIELHALELQSTTVGEADGARAVEIVVTGPEPEVLAALDRVSQADGVRAASLSS